MTDWTPEQNEAIKKSGCNIIVSAGAGSGKTAVLSERVIEKLKSGIHVNELLILTFTKAAASEMKDRIRKKIMKNSSLNGELNLLNSSYITTFDSYALSVTKKYHYLLGISSDISISDESLVILEEKKIIDKVFDEFYLSKSDEFESLIRDYCVKNDKHLKENVLKIANSINERIDREEYLEFIKNEFFSEEYINNLLKEYSKFIDDKKRIIRLEFENLNYYFDNKLVSKVEESISSLLNSDINELHLFTSVNLPRFSYPSEESKKIKENFKDLLDELLSFASYGTLEDIRKSILNNKRNIGVIVDIIKRYIKELDKYKKENNIYTFSDIARLSIKVLKENESVRNEIRNSFKEIMIDEYQDTDNIQDAFISLISNNNVYMVGDIKQSIYKFRGSNPNIFKSKYDNYSKNIGGYKIDLIKNFRSRNEVLNNINDIFRLVMDDNIGGANYKESHEMVYGNDKYDIERMDDFNYNASILEYEASEEFTGSEIEIFTIANDIKNKINNKIQVFDKETGKLRDIKYSDFVIILDRSNYFNDYKKVFEYLGIPLTILKDDKLNDNTDLLLIKNIIDFVIRINTNDFGIEFRYDYLSIARSFLYEYSDKDIFEIIKNNTYKETSIYKDLSSITSINSKTSYELLDEIICVTKFYEKINKVGDYENTNVRLMTLSNMALELNNMGLSIIEFKDYLDELVSEKIEIKYSGFNDSSDSVKIMTIHKSKGLEYPICYFADLDHKFNLKDSSEMIVASSKYGLLIPNTDDNDNNILKLLYRYDYLKEEISERIRLFYVALTRAREKIVIVLPSKETRKLEKNSDGVIEEIRRLNIIKLSDIIYSVKDCLPDYFESVDISKIGLTKNYLFKKNILKDIITSKDIINVDEINIENEMLDDKHFSKEVSLINKENRTNMKYGTLIHETLEYIDFKNYDESNIEDKYIREKVSNFMNSDLMKDISNSNIYKEYEFVYEKDNTSYHGVIDLMIEYNDHIDIIDYKLKNIDDENYINQLNGYKDYISSISDKKVNLYLYSLLNSEYYVK